MRCSRVRCSAAESLQLEKPLVSVVISWRDSRDQKRTYPFWRVEVGGVVGKLDVTRLSWWVDVDVGGCVWGLKF